MFNLSNNGCKNWISKILSGEVKAPKKGKTAPMLIISAAETIIVKNIRAINCFFLLFEIWCQKFFKREEAESFFTCIVI